MTVAVHQIAQTFAGIVTVEDQVVATLSATNPTVVTLDIYLSSSSGQPPQPMAISGGFTVIDPTTGDPVDYSSSVTKNVVEAATPQTWSIRLVFDPQPSAPSILVRGYAQYVTFVGAP